MTAMRPERPARPPPCCQVVHHLNKAGRAVAVDRIELKDVLITPQPAVSVEQPGLRQGEERFTGGDRAWVGGDNPCLGSEVERVADVLEPPQAERREHGCRR